MKPSYQQALSMAQKEVADGFGLSVFTERDFYKGRVIHVETDQGFNPEPFYVEFEDDES